MPRKRGRSQCTAPPTHPHHSHPARPRPPPRPHSSDSSSSSRACHSSHSHLLTYHTHQHAWLPLDASTLPRDPPHSPTSLTLLTYNTWTSSPSHTLSQSTALLDIIHHTHADVIALQETTATFSRLLEKQPWVRQTYARTTPDDFWRVAGPDGRGPRSKEGAREACIVLVRREVLGKGSQVGLVKLPRADDEQGCAAVVCSLHSGGREKVRILTSHFTALPENAPLRAQQYAQCLALLCAPSTSSALPGVTHPHLVLLGDFNASSEAEFAPFLSSPPPTSHAAALKDACPPPRAPSSSSSRKRPRPSSSASSAHSQPAAAGGEKEGDRESLFRHRPTFGFLYPYVSPSTRKPRKPRRIDRVFVSSAARVVSYGEVGGEPLGAAERDRCGREGRRWASDHEGVRVGVAFEAGEDAEEEERGEEAEQEEREEEEQSEDRPAKRTKRRKKRRRKAGHGAG